MEKREDVGLKRGVLSIDTIVASLGGCYYNVYTTKGELFRVFQDSTYVDVRSAPTVEEANAYVYDPPYDSPRPPLADKVFASIKGTFELGETGLYLYRDRLDADTNLLEWISYLPPSEKAVKAAETLSKRHNVNIVILETDFQYFSDSILEKTVDQGMFFISAESPEESAQITDMLIKYDQLKHKSLLTQANKKRIENASETSSELSARIESIKREYADAHGKDASLSKIAEILTEQKVDSPSGKPTWFAQTVKRVLENTSRHR